MFRSKAKKEKSLLVDVMYEQIKSELSNGNGFVDFKYRLETDGRVWMEIVSANDGVTLDFCYTDDNTIPILKLAKWNTAMIAHADGYDRYQMFEDSTDNSEFIEAYKPLFEQTLMTYKAVVSEHNDTDLSGLNIDMDTVIKNSRLQGI